MSETFYLALVMITITLTVGGIMILGPIAKQLGAYLEAATQARLRGTPEADMARIHDLLSSIDARLNQIEERQDFAEALISASDPKLLSIPTPVRVPERN